MSKKSEEREALFSEQTQQFAKVCATARDEGCECPVIERDGRRMRLVGKQLIKGIGEVPCERRCQWDCERIAKMVLPTRSAPAQAPTPQPIPQPLQLSLGQPSG